MAVRALRLAAPSAKLTVSPLRLPLSLWPWPSAEPQCVDSGPCACHFHGLGVGGGVVMGLIFLAISGSITFCFCYFFRNSQDSPVSQFAALPPCQMLLLLLALLGLRAQFCVASRHVCFFHC